MHGLQTCAEDHPEGERGQQPAPPHQPDGAAFPLQPPRPPHPEQEQAQRGDQHPADAAEQRPLRHQGRAQRPEGAADQGEERHESRHEQAAPATTAPRARAPPSAMSAPDNPDTKPR
jgi:hypothetical protein